ncbi:hypothetical protein PRZ48_015269 [Zasmidium cellare]|uniref:Uncharacterized protein n=1 Tax=Zasmidium cellare TaxID=395010 RepID=A0ABR0DWN4_ZASCE|nr:hypothetical protein PRZ48_015269 [Zasmidium cellare]
MSDPQSSVWLLQGASDEKSLKLDDEEQILPSWKRSRRLFNAQSNSRRSSWIWIAVLAGMALNNAGWYAAWRGWLLATNSVEKNHLNYFLKPGDKEAIEVPFEHDWTRLEDIEVNGYRYGDANWQPGEWAPGDTPQVKFRLRRLTLCGE